MASRWDTSRRQVAPCVLLPKQVAATKRLFGAHAMISDEGEWEFNMAAHRIQRTRKEKKRLVLLMTLLDKEEYKHVERRYWTRQWVSRREERGAEYLLLEKLFPVISLCVFIPQYSIFLRELD